MARGAWQWIKGIFRRGKTEVDQSTQVELRDAYADRGAATAADLARKLAAKEITLRTFQAELYLTTRNAVIGQYALGRGGAGALTDADRTAIGRLVGQQAGYLREFVREIGAGTLTEAKIAERAQLYPDAAIEAHSRGQAASRGVPVTEHPPAHPRCRCRISYDDDGAWSWVTVGDEAVCPICSALASRYAKVAA